MVPRAHFDRNPVHSASRPLYRDEVHLLRQFEERIYDDVSCYRYLRGYGSDICPDCLNLMTQLTTLFACQNGRYLCKRRHHDVPTYVEMPKNFSATRRILETMTESNIQRLARTCTRRTLNLATTKQAYPYSCTWENRSIFYREHKPSLGEEETILYAMRRLAISPGRDRHRRRSL